MIRPGVLPLLLLLMVFGSSCGGAFQPSEVDSLIFGEYHGNAVGEFSAVFKFANGQTMADTSDSFYFRGASGDPSKYDWFPVAASDTALIYRLIRAVPKSYSGVDSTFGHPDRMDQGGAFVILYGMHKMTRLNLDLNTGELPRDLQDLPVAILAATGKLHQQRDTLH